MRITDIAWDDESVGHISRHQVKPEEVEEVCFGDPIILKGRQKLYYALGQTLAGRYLFIVFKPLGAGKARVITARDMTQSERDYFKKIKKGK